MTHSAGISPRTGSNMGSIRTILTAVSGITCIAVVIAFSEKSNSCSNCAAFAVRHSVSPGVKVSQLPVGCRLRHRHRPLRRIQPLAYWVEETVRLLWVGKWVERICNEHVISINSTPLIYCSSRQRKSHFLYPADHEQRHTPRQMFQDHAIARPCCILMAPVRILLYSCTRITLRSPN